MARIICLIIGYAFGMIQGGYIMGRLRGVDIRKLGSGNAGTTNALRNLGLKAGLITLAVDMGKCLVAVFVTWLIFHGRHREIMPLLKIYTGAGVVLGHNFPFYLGFKGGKGIAASAGMIIAFGDWRLILLGVVVFFSLFLITHYVSLGSLGLMASFLIGLAVVCFVGHLGMPLSARFEMLLIVAGLTVLAYISHRKNIGRLATGTERKTYLDDERNRQEEKEYQERMNKQ